MTEGNGLGRSSWMDSQLLASMDGLDSQVGGWVQVGTKEGTRCDCARTSQSRFSVVNLTCPSDSQIIHPSIRIFDAIILQSKCVEYIWQRDKAALVQHRCCHTQWLQSCGGRFSCHSRNVSLFVVSGYAFSIYTS